MALTVNPIVQLRALTTLGLTLHLSVHPSQTIEASGAGYRAVPLTAWTVEGKRALHREIVFTFSGALGTVYGYYVTGPDGAVLLRDDIRTPEGDPQVIRVAGDEIAITPVLRVL